MHREQYILGNNQSTLDLLELRKAEKEGKFVFPYLSDCIKLLDCGCGTGSLTQGFLPFFPKISIYGIDIDPAVINIAQKRTNEGLYAKVSHYKVGSIYEIPFKAKVFDVVFGHSILMQLKDPSSGIKEMKRVLNRNGVICLREPNYKLDNYSNGKYVKIFWEIFCKILKNNNGDPFIGSKIPQILKENGFKVIYSNINYSEYGSDEIFINKFSSFVKDSNILEKAMKMQLITSGEKRSFYKNVLNEITNSKFRCLRAYCEVVAAHAEV